ncbi:MAG TPA: chemotaxis protein CheD [Bryobacteraceae bacterium]|nr:chemotaxis protein CheD [Bryobacteraceae bacterium]
MTTNLEEINILPGRLYVARRSVALHTILGSCVSATFRSARLGAGAMCHGLLPNQPTGSSPRDAHRYVDASIRYLIQKFESMGALRRELEVKLFGGADVLAVPDARGGKPTVGALNCRAALAVLEEAGIPVAAADLGGLQGRTILFDTATGEVLVRRLATGGAQHRAADGCWRPRKEGRD